MARAFVLAALGGAALAAALGFAAREYADSQRRAAVATSAPPAAAPAASRVPRPPAPINSQVRIVEDATGTLAAWVDNGKVIAARFTPATGWTDVRPLEAIRGDATDLQLASNARGVAMAVWRHQLGEIQSLRFSRYEASTGWSPPGVVPGVLPRALSASAVPKLELDAEGDALLQWPSGFADTRMQSTTFDPGRGWSAPQDLQQSAQGAGAWRQ